MTRELCVVCTGSYTGEFSPKWRGPWAKYFDATGQYLPLEGIGDERGEQATARTDRLKELREQGRVPMGDMTFSY